MFNARTSLLIAATLVHFGTPGVAAPLSVIEEAKIAASDAAPLDLFGTSAAMFANTAVFGASGDDGPFGSGRGSAYVFVRDENGWSEQTKLVASDGAIADYFGISVAISGDTIVVGAQQDDGPAGNNQGSAYVFVRDGLTWIQQAKLTASNADASDWFGNAVAIDGDTIAVGAPFHNGIGQAHRGSAYIFVRSGTSWSQEAELIATDASADDQLGFCVAISGDSVIAGAFSDAGATSQEGSAYVFTRSGASWTQQAKLTASDAANGDQFGYSVAIRGDDVAVGSNLNDGVGGFGRGAVYMFVRNGIAWTQQQKLLALSGDDGDLFGTAVSLETNRLIVGSEAELVYVFDRDATGWNQRLVVTGSSSIVGDRFGRSASISGDLIAIGAAFDEGTAGLGQGAGFIDRLISCCGGDMDADGQVAAADLPLFVSTLLDGMGTPTQLCAADLNEDGFEDARDIAELVTAMISNSQCP